MKFNVANVDELVFIGVTSGMTFDKNLQRDVPRYYLSVDCNGDVGKLPCTLEIFNSVCSEFPKYSRVIVFMGLDTYKKEFVVVKVGLAKEKKPATSES